MLAQEAEKVEEDCLEMEVQRLMRQQRLWRVINSAQWVAWGIVQAKVPGMEAEVAQTSGEADCKEKENQNPDPDTEPEQEPEEDAEMDFDYLAYAQDRAMFFWADMLALKLVDRDELPRELVEYVKTRVIEY